MTVKIFRIRDRKTGLWSSGGGSPKFKRSGKTWDNLGHVTSHISTVGIRDASQLYADAEIVEYVIEESESRTIPISEIINRKIMREKLYRKYGRDVSDLITDLEKNGLEERYRWCLQFATSSYSEDFKSFVRTMKDMGLKRGTYRSTGVCYIFEDKDMATLVRVASPFNTEALDLVTLLESF